ncbi:hypothetical protein MKW94_010016 [Papaver nudicaule]|uniref:Uncharacterized protein n=1 Tax=Papaver nudicaule TaxID=74823 RepID=A0AA41SEA4_PAPNU|nr:hypothetical protein [Papaver nudicaule]
MFLNKHCWTVHGACSQDAAVSRRKREICQSWLTPSALPPYCYSAMNSWHAGMDLPDMTPLPKGR